ncbi:MAG: PAS domain S-box protein [Chloroflexi bacterium]|jgi:PAS domain S-box-containing protein|nr:PAS domain S-box protein [Chloroflexota bacterium]MBT7081312.1 PAS domain S-box protein [Chloroflexota bacterium]MBT7290407.1 PAS domain S-box protein [Chloroflexota bacterium]
MTDQKQKKESIVVENTFQLVPDVKDMSMDIQSTKGDDWYRLLLDIANDGLTVHLLTPGKKPGKFIEANRVICERLGYTRDELLKLSPSDVTPKSYTDVLAGLKKKLLGSKHLIFELAEKTRDGREIPVEINSHLFERDGQQYILSVSRDITGRKQADVELTQARDNLEKQGSRSIEVLHYRKDKTIFSAFSSVTIIKDASGEPVGVVTVVRDMTEQKRARPNSRSIRRTWNRWLRKEPANLPRCMTS